MKTVITYGTFDLFHVGHLHILRRLAALGDQLIVAVSTDEFNAGKGKKTIIPFEQRIEIVSELRCVDLVIPEISWEQKIDDIKRYDVDIFAIGDDWLGRFDHLSEFCEVVYMPRTEGISSTEIKTMLKSFNDDQIDELKRSLEVINALVKNFA